MSHDDCRRAMPWRTGAVPWWALVFLFGFAAILIAASYWFLLPAMEAARHATTQERRSLAAFSRLLLAVLLMVLFCSLMMAFRLRRIWQSGRPKPTKPKPTAYVDAWKESAERLETPPDEDEDEGEGERQDAETPR